MARAGVKGRGRWRNWRKMWCSVVSLLVYIQLLGTWNMKKVSKTKEHEITHTIHARFGFTVLCKHCS